MKDYINSFNAVFKRQDDIYRRISRQSGLSDCAQMVIYFLRLNGDGLTQAEISSRMIQPRQSVNSAISVLKEKGLVRMENDSLNHKIRRIFLTEEGIKAAVNGADRIIMAETRAFEAMKPDERKLFLELYRKYVEGIDEGLENE